MEIVVKHDFSSLEPILEKLAGLLGVAMIVTATKPAIDAAPANPGTLIPNEATASATTQAPAGEAQTKRGRGRPRADEAKPKTAETGTQIDAFSEVSEPPAKPETKTVDVEGTKVETTKVDTTPAVTGPVTPEEVLKFKTLVLALSGKHGDAKYLKIRAEHGNPNVKEMRREDFDKFLAACQTAHDAPAAA